MMHQFYQFMDHALFNLRFQVPTIYDAIFLVNNNKTLSNFIWNIMLKIHVIHTIY